MAIPQSFAAISFKLLSIFNFLVALPGEEEAIDFCTGVGLIPGRDLLIYCTKCRRNMNSENRDDRKPGWRYRCTNKKCRKSLSPLINTFFEETKLEIRDILLIIFSFVSNLSVTTLVEHYSIPETTIIQWYTFCREVCMTIMNQDSEDELIGGLDLFVEVDEAHLSSRKDHKGRVLKGEQIWVLGIICRETKQCKVIRVHDKKKKTLIPIMQKHVHPDSIVVTDSAKVYVDCEKYGFKEHHSVCHQRFFVSPSNKEIHTNTIENMWSRLKPSIKSHQSKLNIDHYIGEWCYREKYFKEFDATNNIYNRIAPGLRFEKFITDIIRLYPGIGKVGLQNPYYDHISPESSPHISQSRPTRPSPKIPPMKSRTPPPLYDPDMDEHERDLIERCKTILNRFMNACVYRVPHMDLLEVNLTNVHLDITDLLQTIRAANVINYQEGPSMRKDSVETQLPRAFLDNYLPVSTSPNGDCFYNAVSICLFGHDRYSPALRLATVAMLFKYRTQYGEMGRRTGYDIDDALCGAGTSHELLGLATTTYGHAVMDEYHWANSLSNAGTSLAIGRPIYIYFTFRNSENRWLWNSNNLTSEQLDQLGNNGGIVVLGTEAMRQNRRPIRVLLHNRHYTALLPCCERPFEFRPSRPSEIGPLRRQN